ncbi:energy transducer TonB [Hymenobacter defluvii]|uniref:TonB family protein n=1 Tax=Hymenobacter defluvii TaxID=2054411 RepID=A0ABS3T8L0_9BACT|nr:energy transducer TonB [Hymenobacter defluvii]MBO3269988.1 TonB family protein [Hymenobacter defluvii]
MRTASTLVLPLLLLGAPLSGWAQATQPMTVSQKNPAGREEFNVLTTDTQTKQGAYRQYGGRKGNTLLAEGFYTAGQKDSLWTEYFDLSSQPKAKGHYRRDQKVGEWEYYTPEGTLATRYDHTTGQLLFRSPSKWPNKLVIRPLSKEVVITEPPIALAGNDALARSVGMSVRYPVMALRNRVGGEVRVAFTIDSNGNTSNHRVVRGIGYGCDEEALRAVQLLHTEWIPASANGQPVASECEMPVSFAIR